MLSSFPTNQLKSVFATLLILGFASALSAQSTPDLQAHASEGQPGNAQIKSITSDANPAEGQTASVIDGNTETFVRHEPENVVFTIEFKEAVPVRMVRIFCDIVDEVEVTMYNGERRVASHEENAPYQTLDREGNDYEFYVFRYTGEETTDRITVRVDYYSDSDASRHRMHYVDFLLGGGKNLQLADNERLNGKFQEPVMVGTIYGPLNISGRDIVRIKREENTFLFELKDGSRLHGIPATENVGFTLESGTSRRIAWRSVVSYSSDETISSTLAEGSLVLLLRNGDRLVVKPTGIDGRVVNAHSLAPVQIDPSRISALTVNEGSVIRAQVQPHGEVLVSQNTSFKVRFVTGELTFAASEINGFGRTLPSVAEGASGLQNVLPNSHEAY